MAKILDKDPATYSKERDGFLRDLQHFHDSRGTPYRRAPSIGGKEVDLYLLYNLVTAQGGWLKVNSKNNWSELLEHFHLPSKCVNGSIALKQTYLRYLDRYEKVHFLGEEANRGSDDDEESRHKRWSARALHSVPLSYNYHVHNIAEVSRDYNNLSTDLYKPSDYDRLALSLISPLPNEQDFAINVCTLLSNDGKHTLKLEKHPRIINFLLAHAGVYNHSSLRNLFVHNYGIVRKHPIHNFWRDVLESNECLDLINEEVVEKPEPKSIVPSTDDLIKLEATSSLLEATQVQMPTPMDTSDSRNAISSDESDSDSDSDLFASGDTNSKPKKSRTFKFKTDPGSSTESELFCLGRTLGTQDYLGQRVLQIATILRNLTFIEDNVGLLAKNRTFIRFLLLCASSQWNYLKNLGFDMLGNLASEFIVRDTSSDKLAHALLRLVTKGLSSQDRLACLSSLEVLNKLSQNEANEDTLLRSLEGTVYEKVCAFLTIHDVMLLIYTLECLYSLSSLGERSCNLIVMNHGVIDTLVSLVTVEGKSYGPKACIGMKLVETVSGGVSTVSQVQQNSTPATQTQSNSTAANAASSTKAPSPNAKSAVNSSANSKASKNIGGTPARSVQIQPQRLMALSSNSATPVSSSSMILAASSPSAPIATLLTSQSNIAQQHAHQQAIHENEQFALSWLRASYEPCANSRINHQEVYKHYINSCTKIGRKGVISPLHFPRCVRSVFGGTVGPNPVKTSTPNEPQFYDGIKVMAHPHLSHALLGTSCANSTTTAPSTSKELQQTGQTNTSLIKSLLATKVNDCMSTVSMRSAPDQNVAQVAARQQRLLAESTKTPLKAEQQQSTKINGARQLFIDDELGDPSVSSTTPFGSTTKDKKEPPQPPPPPLAPLSNLKPKLTRLDIEDTDSVGNNSVASSSGIVTVGIGCVSSTEDGDNSLTSFEGLLNGVPNLENPLNEDSNSKDSLSIATTITSEISRNKPLRLADLLEKKVDKTPMLNGLGNIIKISEKGLDLVENHIEKALEDGANDKKGVKRPASETSVEMDESEAKRPMLSTVNGSASAADSPAPDSVSSSNGDESATVSTAAAKLFADIAADILEDEDEEQLMSEVQPQPQVDLMPQIVMSDNQLIMNQLNQNQRIVVSQNNQSPLKGQPQTVIVQNPGQQRVVMQGNTGQILLSQGLQGQMQIVPSTTQPGQFVLQNTPGTYVMAQPQTAMVHGQPQTVLVTQTAQQQGTGAKTIIILQQQLPAQSGTSAQQKLVVTPQGQQVVVTQVQRPMMHTSSVANILPAPATMPKTTMASTQLVQTVSSNGVKEEVKVVKPKIIRDLTTPFVCEWGDCNIESKFKSANQVYMHVCEEHCLETTEELICQWERCDNMKRKRFSLMTHIHDKHCNTEAMKLALLKRKQTSTTKVGKTEPTPAPASTTPHPGYAPDAALHAIKRHALEFVNPKELQDDNEGPVTKSIRLTASLILRNLVIYSSNCRRYLKHYEPHLANVALSNVESSRTIAQILYDLNESSSHR